jgi:hypothetical protein
MMKERPILFNGWGAVLLRPPYGIRHPAFSQEGQRLMLVVNEDKSLMLLIKKPRSKWYRMCCIGRKRHYRKDGSCKHTEQLFAALKPEIAARTKLDGFGGSKQ